MSGDIGGLFRLMKGGDIILPLRSTASRLVLILLVAAPGVLLGFQVMRIAQAARLGSRVDVHDLRRAIALDPGNADCDYQLGLVYAYSFGQADIPDAVRYLRKAAELNPRKAQYWSDLAEVCDTIDDTTCADQDVRRALTLSPATPRFEWKAANHYLETGRTAEALEHFRRLLALDDKYAQPVFQLCLRVEGNPQTILNDVMPAGAQTRLKLAYLEVASAQGRFDFAGQLWKQVLSEGLACNFADVRPYLENLLAAGDIQQAAIVWRRLEHAGVIPGDTSGDNENLVYNGRFDHAPLGTGFDWRAGNTPYVETDFNDSSAYRGPRCLRVDYAAGRNLESEPVYELVPVLPRQAYRLRAEVRSENITSDSGPRLRVMDPECPSCLNVSTQTTVGTTNWHELTLDFAAGAHTKVVRLSVWRARSWTFPMEISGSFWLDDVSITPMNSAPRETASTN
jgi:tetratricopeptide (TPR) repeat protein